MSNLIRDLKKEIQPMATKAYKAMNNSAALKNLGVEKVVITETKRELAVQMAYYSRSRMKDTKDVKAMYKAAGLYEPSEYECNTANTQTLFSNHIKGTAIDFAPCKDGKIWWSAPDEVWNEMGKIGKNCGFSWGGDWTEWPDKPHFEVV
ncbi:MAG: M15 family metallopeptidase [Treponema sp.]|nr:M15 family metallopeptidase [Treponema sp.]